MHPDFSLLPPSDLLLVPASTKPNQKPEGKRAQCVSIVVSLPGTKQCGEGWRVPEGRERGCQQKICSI